MLLEGWRFVRVMDRVIFLFTHTLSPTMARLRLRARYLCALAASCTLVVPDGAGGLCAGRQGAACDVGTDSQPLIALGSAVDVVVVIDLAQLGAAVVERALAGVGLVVLGPAAADVGNGAVAMGQSGLDVGEGVGGCVGGADVGGREPAPGRQGLVVGDDGLVEVKKVVILASLGALFGGLEVLMPRGG